MMFTTTYPQQQTAVSHQSTPVTNIDNNMVQIEMSGRLRTELDQIQLSVAEAGEFANLLACGSETAVSSPSRCTTFTHTTCEFVTTTWGAQ